MLSVSDSTRTGADAVDNNSGSTDKGTAGDPEAEPPSSSGQNHSVDEPSESP